MKRSQTNRAFTLIELMIVIAITVLITSVSGAVYANLIQNTYLDTISEEIVANLRLAQMRSISNFHDQPWGIHFNDTSTPGESDSFILFQGSDYASRDNSWDIETELPPNITYTIVTLTGGGDDVVFDQLSGQTIQNGTIQITNTQTETKTINVNQMGQIELN